MSAASPTLADLARLLVRHPLRWLLPAAVVAAAATYVALKKTDVWEATLAVIVRAEAGGNSIGAGRFRDLSEMKTLQETVMEIAKNRAVLQAALVQVGPPDERSPLADAAKYPSPTEVDDLSEGVRLVPPKGAEFGSTEVFYLKVKDRSPHRAVQLADAVAAQMLERFRRLRDEKAGSMVRELEEAASLARADLNEVVARLKKFESQVGADIGELRNLEQQGAGSSDLRQTLLALDAEVRTVESTQRNLRELAEILAEAQAEPTKILATPNRLLESQPSLRKLKDGLIDAQLRTSQLLGGMSREHPLVRAALDAENEVRAHLHDELAAAVVGVQAEMAVTDDLLAERRARLAATRQRLDQVTALRAEYSALNGESQHRLRQLELSEKAFIDARAAQAGAAASSLLTKIDTPDVGTKPVGPGKTMLLAGGLAGGLLFGVGVLLLTTRLPRQSDPNDVAAVVPVDESAAELRPARRATPERAVTDATSSPAA